MHRRSLGEDVEEVIRIHLRDLVDIELSQPFGQLGRSGEGALHGHLLIEEHSNEQSEAVFGQQCIGLRISRQEQ